jgi:membrane-associated phospholipid phosphatase
VSLAQLDRQLLVLARTRGHPHWAERAVGAFSRTGEHAACWLVLGAGGSLLDRDPVRRPRWRRGAAVVAGAYAANFGLKLIVRRRRPQLPGLPPLSSTVSNLSFPSAHATTSFAAARLFRGLVPTPALYGAALSFAASRLYLGVHFPSDVVAGAAFGTLIGNRWSR